ELPPVALKIAWGADKLNHIADPNFSLVPEDYPNHEAYIVALRKFLTNYVAFVAVIEGIFFYCSFVQVMALARIGKMRKFAEQIQYIMRDETMHVRMGMKIIRDIIRDNPDVWNEDFANEARTLVLEGLFVEMAFADYTIGDGILGLTRESMFQYLQCIADSRLSSLGLGKVFNVSDPFPWMDEAIHITKEKNFFETRVTEYQVGGALTWDD
ncbi:MAG: ribonucleotide-diphosphate reductase subunit beta, partial [Spirochaetota bacterium]